MYTFVSNLISLGFNFCHLINTRTNSIYLSGVLSVLNKLIVVKHLEHCLTQMLFVKIILKVLFFFGRSNGKIYLSIKLWVFSLNSLGSDIF